MEVLLTVMIMYINGQAEESAHWLMEGKYWMSDVENAEGYLTFPEPDHLLELRQDKIW